MVEIGGRKPAVNGRPKRGLQFCVVPRIESVPFETLIPLNRLAQFSEMSFDNRAPGNHGSYLVLFLDFPIDKILDIRMISVQNYHLCSPTGGSAALYGRSRPIKNLEERKKT